MGELEGWGLKNIKPIKMYTHWVDYVGLVLTQSYSFENPRSQPPKRLLEILIQGVKKSYPTPIYEYPILKR